MKRVSILFAATVLFTTGALAQGMKSGNDFSKPNLAILNEMNLPAKAPAVQEVKLSNGIRLQYVEQGDAIGTPVIFLHGLTDSWHSFEPILPHLPQDIHAFVLTQRGHGDSDKPGSYQPSDFAKDIHLFMKKLKISSAVIVGHSMGSVIAQRFALDYPGKTLGLVLVGAFASFNDKPSMREFSSYVETLTDPIPEKVAVEFQQSTIARPVSNEYFKMVVGETMKVPARVWKGVMKGLITADFTMELPSLEKPALLVWGDKDIYATLTDQQRLLNAIGDAKFIGYEGTGHAVHWEEPGRFVADLGKFLESLKEGSVHGEW